MGKITNWKELGGASAEIVVISRDTSSGTYEVWEEKVMKKERVFPGALLQASSGAIVQAVSKNKNAIGYLGIGYVDKSVKALTVGGIRRQRGEHVERKISRLPAALHVHSRMAQWGGFLNFINYVLNPQGDRKWSKKRDLFPCTSR